mmetsp:Transcript_7987/g.27120  ORF Transcript_7987/g.27120 Transcript_7987/m.27120 type:complete len:361 (+) Transcript_7987:292-1374(+)
MCGRFAALRAEHARRTRSEVDGLVVGGHGSLLEGLAHRRMRVARARDVLGARAVLHGEHRLGDHLARVPGDDVHSEDLARLLVRDELDDAVRVGVGARARVGHERKLAHRVGGARRLDLLLGEPHGGHLRVGVDHVGDAVVVDVAVLARDDLRHGDALLLRLVREHGPADHVADGVHARDVGPELIVHVHDAPGAHGDVEVLEAQALRVGAPADGHEDHVRLERLLLARFVVLHDKLAPSARALPRDHLRVEHELDALLGEGPLEGLGDLVVQARGDAVQELDDGHLGPEAPPHGAHLKADHARANNRHLLGDGLEVQGARGGDDGLLVHRDGREGRRHRARGDDDVLALRAGRRPGSGR